MLKNHLITSKSYFFSNIKKANYFILFILFISFQITNAQSVTFTPTSLDFGSVDTGNSNTLNVTGTASDSETIAITAITITGTNASEFNYSYNFGAPIDQSVPVQIDFNPTTAGNKTATAQITTNPALNSPYLITLGGSSEVALVPEISYNGTIDFGGQDFSTTTSQDLIIENIGNSPLTISNIAMVAGYLDETQFSLPAGLSFPIVVPAFSTATAISVSFSPEITGAVTGNNRMARIEITSNDTTSPSIVNLQGNILDPNLEITFLPAPYDFGNVNVNVPSTKNITIKNTGDGTLVVSNLSIGAGVSNSYPEDYTLVSPTTFPFNVAPNSTQNISIKFTPGAIGFRYSQLLIQTVNSTNETVNITGTGIAPNFTPSTTSLAFSELRVGGSSQLNFTITNNGNGNLNLSSGTISGAGASSFAIVGTNTAVIIAPGAGNARTFTVNYIPTDDTTHQAKITYTSDALDSPHEITLSGSAIDSDLQTSATNLDFGDINIGETSTNKTITLSNTNGTDAVNISNITISGEDDSDFSLIGISLPIIIDAGSEATFDANFSPTSDGNKTAQINIISNDSNSPQTISLTGNTLAPGILLSSPMLNFLDTKAVVQTRTKLFNIINNGDADLMITGINIKGANASDFQFQGITLPLTIPPISSKTVEVVFSPQVVGTRAATLTVSSDFVADTTIGLLGKGDSPIISAVNDGILGQIRHNRTQTKTITLTNKGTSDLIISEISILNTVNDLFSLPEIDLPQTIGVGDKYDIEVFIDPASTTIGSSSVGNLQIAHNDNTQENPLFNVVLAATPTDFQIPTFSVASNLLELPTTVAGETSFTNLPITNNGTSDLIITAVFFGGGSSARIRTPSSVNTFPIVITPGNTDNLKVRFSPLEDGTHQSRLLLLTNDPDLPFSTFHSSNFAEIIATGGVAAPGFQVTNENQDPIMFLDTSLGRTSKQTIRIVNTGSDDLNVFTHPDDNQGMFQITSSSSPLSILNHIAPGETIEITVTFTPTGGVGLKEETLKIITNIPREPFFSSTTFDIPVAGHAGEAQEVIVGGMLFKADNLTIASDIATLVGNVHTGSLEFDSDVVINLNTNEITGNGDIYITDIPKIGPFGGKKVLLQSGEFSFVANLSIPEIDLTSDADTTNFVFDMVGIPLEITKIKILAEGNGIELGGRIPLPELIFGEDEGIIMDAIQISKTAGVNVTGSIAINPAIDIFDTFALKGATITFDTFTNSYSGAASIGFDLLGKEIGIGAEIAIINGGLDSVALEIEVSPGIPIAQTGFALSGGNGFISGLQVPPISFGLGVDISPVAPGFSDAMRFNNMQIAYTIGTSLEASGELQVLGVDVAGASLKITSKKVEAAAFVDLFTVFVGNLDASIESVDEVLMLEANADLTVTIPELPCFVCGPINAFLPYTLAEAEAHLDNNGMDASVEILEILRANVAVDTDGDITVGANFITDSGRFASAANSISRSASSLVFENDHVAKAKDHLEGQSLIIEAGSHPFSRSSSSGLSDIPFTLTQSHNNVIVRVEGTTSTPNYTLILPDGTEVTPENAKSLGVFYSTFDAEKKAYYILENTSIGTYYFRIDDSDTYQFDVVTSEFAPELSNITANHNTTTNDVMINWTDNDEDSDATIAFYYDIDNKGGDGLLIQSGISENDNTDQITWNATDLKNGTYYIYGRIDDGTNTAKVVYSTNTFTINNPSLVPTTTLVADRFVDNIVLSWTEIPGADHYVVYIDEDPLTLFSPSQGVGANTAFDFKDIMPGRTYNFAVTVFSDNGTELIESNLSNIETVTFISTTSNNIPKLETETLPVKLTSCDEYVTTIAVSDPDATDVLSLTMVKFPQGMTLTGKTLNWFPTKDQKGKHEVILEVNDGNGGTDKKSYTVTIFEVDDVAPEITTCLTDVSVDADANNEFKILDYISSVTATDNCSSDSNITITQDVAVGSTVGIGDTVITFTATDENKNESTCSFTITVNSILGIDDVNLEKSIVLYPNPATHLLTIKSDARLINEVIIYDVLGKVLLTTHKSEIDISSIATGSYFARIIGDNGRSVVKKFIKK